MAEGKKSFILYSNQKEIFSKLSDEQAGKLIKHVFEYVNDNDPEADDPFVDLAFTMIKNQLKDDLNKWENQRQQRVEAGKRSAEARRKNKERNSTSVNERSTKSNETERNPTVNGNVNVNVNVNDNVNDNKELFYRLDDKFFITKEEFEKLKTKYSVSEIDLACHNFEDYVTRLPKKYKEYKSMYLTINKWLAKDRREENKKSEKEINKPTKPRVQSPF